MNVVELFVRQALARPEATALLVAGQAMTYGDLLEQVKRQAAHFAATGVSRGDVVAVAAGPAGFVASALALAWLGAVSVPAQGRIADVREDCASLRVKFVFHSGTDASEYAFSHEGFAGAFPRKAGAGITEAPPVAVVEPGDAWHIALSSGTTGRRKGVAYSHERTILNVNLLRVQYPLSPGDRVYIGMVPSMAYAIANWLRCFAAGACAVMPRTPESTGVLKALHEDGITHALLAVGIATDLARTAAGKSGRRAAPPPQLRALSVGGAKVPPQVADLLVRHVCPEVYIHYGATEANLVAVLDNATRARYPRSAGRLLPWVEAQAVGDDGAPLPPGQRGRLRMRSATLGLGYVGVVDDADAHAFRGGWFQSNDMGAVFPDGIVQVHGRANEVLNFGGVKMDGSAIEEAILEDHAISECAVVEVGGDLGQPVPAVVVVSAAADLDVEGLRERCRKLSPHLVPRLVVRADKLPRNDSGKVMRGAVRRAVESSPEFAALRQPAGKKA